MYAYTGKGSMEHRREFTHGHNLPLLDCWQICHVGLVALVALRASKNTFQLVQTKGKKPRKVVLVVKFEVY